MSTYLPPNPQHDHDHPIHAPAFKMTLAALKEFVEHVESERRQSLDGATLSRHYGDVFTICTSPEHNQTTSIVEQKALSDARGKAKNSLSMGDKDYDNITSVAYNNGQTWCYTEYQMLISEYIHNDVFLKLKAIKENNYSPDKFLQQYLVSWNNFKTLLASLSVVFEYLDRYYFYNSPYCLETRSCEMWFQELYDLSQPAQVLPVNLMQPHQESFYTPYFTPERSNFFCSVDDLKVKGEDRSMKGRAVGNKLLSDFIYPAGALVRDQCLAAFLELVHEDRENSVADAVASSSEVLPTTNNIAMSDDIEQQQQQQQQQEQTTTTTTMTDTETKPTTTTTAKTTTTTTTKQSSSTARHEQISTLLRQFTDAVLELGQKSSLSPATGSFMFYVQLQDVYIADVKSYYTNDVNYAQLSFQQYAAVIAQIFSTERQRITKFLQTSTIATLNATLHELILKPTLEPLLSRDGAMDYYTNESNLHYTKLLFDLVGGHGPSLNSFGRHFQDHVQTCGGRLLQDFFAKKTKYMELKKQPPTNPPQPLPKVDPVELVQNLINLDAHFRNVVQVACANHPAVLTSLRHASEVYINSQERFISQILAQYIHSLLSSRSTVARGQMAPDALQHQIQNISHIFKYIRNKDVFEQEYQRLLCQRLLSGDSLGQSNEKEALSALTRESGAEFTKKADSINTDLELSQQHTAKFKQSRANFLAQHGDVDVQFYVCRSNSGWVFLPSQYSTRYTMVDGLVQNKQNNPNSINNYLKLPRVMQEVWQQFGQYYCQQFERRYLDYRLDEGICEVTFTPDPNNPQNTKILVVTPIMAAILLHLAQQPKFILWKDLVQQLSIDPQLLAEHLLPLCLPLDQPTKCIVRKSTAVPSFKEDDKLILSKQYESSNVRNVIRYERRQTTKDVEKSNQELDKLRLFQCKAVLVRAMKMKKQCTFDALIDEAISQLSNRFVPSAAMLKDAIEALIENDDILERDETNRNMLLYRA